MSIRSRYIRQLSILILLQTFLISVGVVYSGETAGNTVNILLYNSSSDNVEQYSFSNVIYESISFELKSAGFAVLSSQYGSSTEDLLQSAIQKRASFLIESKYSTNGKNLKLTLKCYRAVDGANLLSTSGESKMDLDLDSFIRDEAMEVVTQIKKDIETNPQLLLDKLGEPDPTTSKDKKQADTSTNAEGGMPSGDSKTIEASRINSRGPVIPAADFKHFTISSGFSPFMTTGDASKYFTTGMGPDIHGGYNFQTSYGYIGLGIYSSFIYFVAEGVLLSSDNMLISAGPEIRFGINANSFLGLFLGVNGGVTVFMMNRNNEGYKNAFIPFFSGGMGLTMNITPGLGFVFAANYALYIETSVLITGFSPSAGIYLRL